LGKRQMSWKTHWITLRLRSLGRKLGLNRVAARLISSERYEARFQELMLAQIEPGDCVWDIGANVGLYTAQFAERVGEQGMVFAFEPSPVNFESLKQAVRNRKNVAVFPVALGASQGTVRFQQGEDDCGATSKVLNATETEPADSVEVKMVRGDELVRSGQVTLPNVIKIDTEGFEMDVLEGLGDVIGDPRVRALCIEVHFGLLSARGLHDAPARIEALLADAEFQTSWPDASHIVAERRSR
jgi:FkbM family methyltransferase